MAEKIKKLIRPMEGRVIAGVARAFANYFNVDIALVRIIWALLLLPGGFPGVVFYIICWILIPSEK
ncbi:MAG TPA: PspC domain-containing protein [Patescibacteria group bacterium]|nr:PspC domain-containing protein [Patescibacteria group bacterium]